VLILIAFGFYALSAAGLMAKKPADA
jgi:hypothetical protein